MNDRFDVIVVGARCAGAPLATLLARQGLKVAIVERATFPKDTLSTHIFQAAAINFLGRLGVLDAVLETGAQPYTTVRLRQEDFQATFELEQRPGDTGGAMCVRRFVLDPILLEAAADAGRRGADVDERHGTRLRRRPRSRSQDPVPWTGPEADGQGSSSEPTGAIRPSASSPAHASTTCVPGERFGYWGYFENADSELQGSLVFHRWDGRFVIAMPADAGPVSGDRAPGVALPARVSRRPRSGVHGAYAGVRACRRRSA